MSPGTVPPSAPLGQRPRSPYPRYFFRGGSTALLLAGALFLYSVHAAPFDGNKFTVVPHDGGAHSSTLLEDTQYGLFSDDHGLRCQISGPSGDGRTLTNTLADSHHSPRQVLGFRSDTAGAYTISCEAASEVRLAKAEISPEQDGAFRFAEAAGVVGVLAVLAFIVSGVWFAALALHRPRPVEMTPMGIGPTAPGAAPSPPSSWSTGAVPGSYGLAPQQVVYRPLPPPDGGPPGGQAPGSGS